MADPIWLADVLRAEGLECDILDGAFDRGHGNFGSIWGVVMHHTGDEPPYDAGPWAIANHPTLGLCSQLHLGRGGKFTLCGVGIAYHAGQGSWPGIARDNANAVTIGIEAENNGTEGWSQKQYSAYTRGVGAILRKLEHDSSRVIGHKEWAAVQGKWDPGGMDMSKARADIQRVIDSSPGSGHLEGGASVWGETFKNWKKATVSYGFAFEWIDKLTNWTYDQFMGPDGKGWKILGKSIVDPTRDNTLVEAVAELRQDVKNLTELVQRGGK